MAYSDIQRLRQQQIFSPVEDMSNMGMDYGMGMDSYEPEPYDVFGENTPRINPYQGIFGGEQAPKPRPYENIFNQKQPVPTQPTPSVTPPSPDRSIQDTIDAINRVYTPESMDRDRLRKLMDMAPVRERPSLARSLVAGALSVKAQDPIKTAEAVQYAPHHRAMADWTAKTDPFLKTAELENRANINERTLAGNVVTSVTAANKLAEQARQADQKNEVAMERNRVARIRAEMGPGYRMNARGPTVVVVDQATGKVTDTGISTGWMSEAEKIDAEGEWREKAAKASGQAALDRTVAAGSQLVVGADGQVYEVNPRITGNVPGTKPVEGLPPGTPTRIGTPIRGAVETPTQAKDRQQMAWQELHASDPQVQKWTRRSPSTGLVTLKPKPTMGSWFATDKSDAADIAEYEEVVKKLYPGAKPPETETKGIAPGSTKIPEKTKSGIGPTYGPELPDKFKATVPGAPEKAPTVGTGRGTGYDPNRGRIIETQADRDAAAARTARQASTVPDPQQSGRQIQLPPLTQEGVKPVVRFSPSRKAYQISYDGGKTFRPYTPTYVGQ